VCVCVWLSVLWRCWLGSRKGIRPVKNWVVRCWRGYLQGADLHMAQLMPLLLTVSCSSKIHIGFTFMVPAHPGSPGKRAVKQVCMCVCVLHAYFLYVKNGNCCVLNWQICQKNLLLWRKKYLSSVAWNIYQSLAPAHTALQLTDSGNSDGSTQPTKRHAQLDKVQHWNGSMPSLTSNYDYDPFFLENCLLWHFWLFLETDCYWLCTVAKSSDTDSDKSIGCADACYLAALWSRNW